MSIKNNFNKIAYYLRRYGFWQTLKKVFKRIFHIKENRKTNQEQYEIWMSKNNPTEEILENQRKHNFDQNPKISIVVPMYNTNETFFKELVESVESQTYSNWELCLADGSPEKNENFKKYYENNEKIKYNFLNKNLGISENTNEAIKLATGNYIGFLDHDDLLSEDALYEVVNAINENNGPDFIYSDEDKIDENGERFEPYFKPDYSPETLEVNNYITHFVVVKKELVEKIGALNSEFNGAQDFDFVLRATENTNKIIHISKILYHWRVHNMSTANVADSKPYAFEAGKKVVEEHLKRVRKKWNSRIWTRCSRNL
jgi:glycosyltransferase involved in cell wall biosynthesis